MATAPAKPFAMMRARATLVALLVVGMTASACSGGGRTSGQPTASVPFVAVDPASTSRTDRAIAAAQLRLTRDNGDRQALLDLANAYLQKVRETADPSLYAKAGTIIDGLAKKSPNDLGVLLARGTLALARHRFADAHKLALKAVSLFPNSVSVYGVAVDAANELGRYDEAADFTQKMVDLRPTLASLSRVSYARELRGDVPGAISAMSQAVTAGGSQGGENVAYVQALLGTLLLNAGDTSGADATFTDALRSFPGFPAARAGQAAVLVARGRPAPAAEIMAEVVRVQPLSAYAATWGDDLMAAGRTSEAQQAYALVDVIGKLFTANGVRGDLELSLFEADHHPGKAALAQARRGVVQHPSQAGHDIVAWNLFKAGRISEARAESAKALVLGPIDPLLRYHAAAIAFAAGDRAAAARDLDVVLRGNPRFSAYLAGDVAKLAAQLGLSVPPPAGEATSTTTTGP